MSCPGTLIRPRLGPLQRPVAGILTVVLCTLATARPAPPKPLESAFASVSRKDLARHINTLASDTLRGRSAGSDGGRAAGSYLVQQLRRIGVEPAAADGDFYQEFSEQGFRNVVSVLPGSDPKLKHRYIVVGAHYDHVGLGTRKTSLGGLGQIHNGADDNASGTAAVLEVAQALAHTRGLAQRRSILFVFWDAEELGLLGSKHWTTHPTIPLSSIDMALNVDMIGRLRDRRLIVFGSRTGIGLRQLAVGPNALLKQPLAMQFNWELKANSDHHPFFAQGVPVLFLHTGLHENYHRPSDDAELIVYDGLEAVTRLMVGLTHEAACRRNLPEFRKAAAGETEAYRRQLETAALTAQQRLGASWDLELARQGIIQLTRVEDDTAADAARLKKGDRLLKLGGKDISAADEFTWRLLASDSPIDVVAQRRGKKKSRQVSLRLPGNPRRLGFEWYTDDAEPHSVVVRGVVPGSPANRAGLENADRILAVDGRSIERARDFGKLLAPTATAISLRIERRGRFQSIRLVTSSSMPPGKVGSTESPRRDETPDRRDR